MREELLDAAHDGNLEKVQEILGQLPETDGHTFTIFDVYVRHTVYAAISGGQLKVLKWLLLEGGAIVHGRDPDDCWQDCEFAGRPILQTEDNVVVDVRRWRKHFRRHDIR
jgi:hypothetical protein